MKTTKELALIVGLPLLGGTAMPLAIAGIYILAAPLVGIADLEQKLFLNHWFLIDPQWLWRP